MIFIMPSCLPCTTPQLLQIKNTKRCLACERDTIFIFLSPKQTKYSKKPQSLICYNAFSCTLYHIYIFNGGFHFLFVCVHNRRDSFITHRAFCDALAQETSTNTVRAISGTLSNNSNPLLLSASSQPPFLLPPQLDNTQFGSAMNSLVKREAIQEVNVPPWLSPPPPLFSTATPPNNVVLDHSLFVQQQVLSQKPNPSPNPPPSAFASATALLQKAAQMGATMSSSNNNRGSTGTNTASPFFKAHQLMSSESSSANNSLGPNAAVSAHQMLMEGSSGSAHDFEGMAHSSLVHDMMSSFHSSNTTPMAPGNMNNIPRTSSFGDHHVAAMAAAAAAGGGGGNFLEVPTSSRGGSTSSTTNNNSEGLTRDFLGLRTFPTRRDQFFNIVGLDQHMNSARFGDHQKHHPDQTPWQG